MNCLISYCWDFARFLWAGGKQMNILHNDSVANTGISWKTKLIKTATKQAKSQKLEIRNVKKTNLMIKLKEKTEKS